PCRAPLANAQTARRRMLPARPLVRARSTFLVLPPEGNDLPPGKLADDLLEILGLAEIAIDRGEADIGHAVEVAQPFHDEFADLLARDLGLAGALELAHDAVDHALHPFLVHRALAQRDGDGLHQLGPVEGHAPA